MLRRRQLVVAGSVSAQLLGAGRQRRVLRRRQRRGLAGPAAAGGVRGQRHGVVRDLDSSSATRACTSGSIGRSAALAAACRRAPAPRSALASSVVVDVGVRRCRRTRPTAERRGPSRCHAAGRSAPGMRLTGVAVTTSTPNAVSITSTGTATTRNSPRAPGRRPAMPARAHRPPTPARTSGGRPAVVQVDQPGRRRRSAPSSRPRPRPRCSSGSGAHQPDRVDQQDASAAHGRRAEQQPGERIDGSARRLRRH